MQEIVYEIDHKNGRKGFYDYGKKECKLIKNGVPYLELNVLVNRLLSLESLTEKN